MRLDVETLIDLPEQRSGRVSSQHDAVSPASPLHKAWIALGLFAAYAVTVAALYVAT